jgi:hypothetical protein
MLGLKMNLKREDLVVRLDEERQVLQLLVLDRTGRADELRIFYEMPAQEVEDSGEPVEHALGMALMSFLSATYSSEAFGLGRYREAAQDMEKGRSQALRGKSAKGDSIAMFELAMQTIAHGLRAKSKVKMQKADQLLREAAAAGNKEAVEYLANLWPALKDRSDQSFN